MRLILASFASVLALAAASAGAQPAPDRPWSAEGMLEDSDPQEEGRHRYDDHVVRLEAGQRYRISASSEAFDTRISLKRSGAAEPVAENDDFGGELNSRITYTPAESGDHVLRVMAFAEEGRGAYTVRAEALPPLPAPSRARASDTARTRWQIWEGELTATDADREGMHFDDYLVSMTAGQTRLISLESDAFDAVIWVMRPDAREGDPIELDDDAGPGLNALLGFRAEADGDYIVRVTTFAGGGTGAYRLRISEALTPPPAVRVEGPDSALEH